MVDSATRKRLRLVTVTALRHGSAALQPNRPIPAGSLLICGQKHTKLMQMYCLCSFVAP